MIIVEVKQGDNIEKALKQFKRKFDRTGTMRRNFALAESFQEAICCKASQDGEGSLCAEPTLNGGVVFAIWRESRREMHQ